MVMAKVKKIVKKAITRKKAAPKATKETTCTACGGTGLLGSHELCSECGGAGTK